MKLLTNIYKENVEGKHFEIALDDDEEDYKESRLEVPEFLSKRKFFNVIMYL